MAMKGMMKANMVQHGTCYGHGAHENSESVEYFFSFS